jgi:endonuclease YncB( thermonuclease family)
MQNNYHEKDLEKNNFDDLELFSFQGLVTKCKIVDVYDGDTITIVFYYNHSPIKIKIRMAGYDTPEVKNYKSNENGDLHKKAGLYVKEKLKNKILNKILWIKFDKEEKYGRTMGFLYEISDTNKLKENDVCINNWIIDNKYGKIYNGGKKEEFTKEELENIIKN